MEDSPSQLKEILKGMERRRHLMVWGDNSTLLNHGHLLLTASAIYDEALYHTNDEMKAKGKDNIDVQSLVERPHVYILGRCGSSEVEQLAYINTRKACLQNLSVPLKTSNGVQITDTMRFSMGMAHNRSLRLENRKGEMLGV